MARNAGVIVSAAVLMGVAAYAFWLGHLVGALALGALALASLASIWLRRRRWWERVGLLPSMLLSMAFIFVAGTALLLAAIFLDSPARVLFALAAPLCYGLFVAGWYAYVRLRRSENR